MRIIPQNKRIVIRPLERDSITESGIYIPEIAKEKPQIGIVNEVPSGSEYGIGDKVLFAKYSGTEIQLDSRKFLLIREEDILGIIIDEVA